MKSYELIHELVSLVERMERENPERELSLAGFSAFLLNTGVETDYSGIGGDVRFGEFAPEAQNLAFQLDNSIGRLLVYMSRYAKNYIKKALQDTPVHSAEEFTALSILLTHEQLTKSELINYNLQEKASGTEVIRRLILAGLVSQSGDLKDKRSKTISITALGREILSEIFVDMSRVGQIITGSLTTSEKLTLHQLLQKLENFHLEHFKKKTITTKADLKTLSK